MSKRARQMALMGFFQGALSDVMKRREQTRMEEAEARKEARLAAIRKEERDQDFAQREALTKYELGERRALAAYEIAAREKLTGMEIGSREKISAADNAARLQANREDNAARIKAQKVAAGSGGGSSERAPKVVTYRGDKSGKVLNLDINNPKHHDALMTWQRTENVIPMSSASVSDYAEDGAAPFGPQASRQSGIVDWTRDPKSGQWRPPAR